MKKKQNETSCLGYQYPLSHRRNTTNKFGIWQWRTQHLKRKTSLLLLLLLFEYGVRIIVQQWTESYYNVIWFQLLEIIPQECCRGYRQRYVEAVECVIITSSLLRRLPNGQRNISTIKEAKKFSVLSKVQVV